MDRLVADHPGSRGGEPLFAIGGIQRLRRAEGWIVAALATTASVVALLGLGFEPLFWGRKLGLVLAALVAGDGLVSGI